MILVIFLISFANIGCFWTETKKYPKITVFIKVDKENIHLCNYSTTNLKYHIYDSHNMI